MHLPEYQYRLFPIPSILATGKLLAKYPEISGLNVTIPYKVLILPFLDELSPEARDIGTVNCIQVIRTPGDTRLIGYNTDVAGFVQSISPLLGKHHTKALVLGSGGASRAVVYALGQLGISSILVTRKPGSANSMNYDDLTEHLIAENTIIINTTPLGMFPETDAAPPIPYQFLGNRHLLFDLIYNPEETVFLRKGRIAGAKVQNGLEMLKMQAEESWKIWNGD